MIHTKKIFYFEAPTPIDSPTSGYFRGRKMKPKDQTSHDWHGRYRYGSQEFDGVDPRGQPNSTHMQKHIQSSSLPRSTNNNMLKHKHSTDIQPHKLHQTMAQFPKFTSHLQISRSKQKEGKKFPYLNPKQNNNNYMRRMKMVVRKKQQKQQHEEQDLGINATASQTLKWMKEKNYDEFRPFHQLPSFYFK